MLNEKLRRGDVCRDVGYKANARKYFSEEKISKRIVIRTMSRSLERHLRRMVLPRGLVLQVQISVLQRIVDCLDKVVRIFKNLRARVERRRNAACRGDDEH